MQYEAQLKHALEEKKRQHLLRQRRILESAQGVEIKVDGNNYLNFCSNDYLGLANHPDIVRRFKSAADQYGVGSGASHMVIGHSEAHHQLEERLAAWVGMPRALLFSSGYMANIGVINSLLGRNDFIYEDRLNHASLLDAGLLSGARFQRFAHNNVQDLQRRIGKQKAQHQDFDERRGLIVVDGVFSMDGDVAPLPQLAALAQDSGNLLMVDDAHGLGVLGEGHGILPHFKMTETEVPIYMGTLGKALGTSGAFVAGSELLIETLVQQARTYIYTTALPPATAAASLESLDVINREGGRVADLKNLIRRFQQGARQLDLAIMNSFTAIQPILVGESAVAMDMSQALLEQGVLVSAIRPPTVPQGSARLRVTLSAAHSEDQLDRLLEALDKAQRKILNS